MDRDPAGTGSQPPAAWRRQRLAVGASPRLRGQKTPSRDSGDSHHCSASFRAEHDVVGELGTGPTVEFPQWLPPPWRLKGGMRRGHWTFRGLGWVGIQSVSIKTRYSMGRGCFMFQNLTTAGLPGVCNAICRRSFLGVELWTGPGCREQVSHQWPKTSSRPVSWRNPCSWLWLGQDCPNPIGRAL